MTSVQDIEHAIERLPPEQFRELAKWVADRDWEAWDRQLETDVTAGKLDKMANEAIADFEAGRCTELPSREA